MTKKRVVDFLLALTGGAIALVGYFYIEDWYYWVVALGGGLLMLIFLILMVRDGRADDMDIQILGDNEISRRNHAVIVFDPKKKETVLLPGDANGIVYLNGNAVYAPATLNKYDEIELGKSKFLFVPFCGENFMWGGKTE